MRKVKISAWHGFQLTWQRSQCPNPNKLLFMHIHQTIKGWRVGGKKHDVKRYKNKRSNLKHWVTTLKGGRWGWGWAKSIKKKRNILIFHWLQYSNKIRQTEVFIYIMKVCSIVFVTHCPMLYNTYECLLLKKNKKPACSWLNRFWQQNGTFCRLNSQGSWVRIWVQVGPKCNTSLP